MQLNEDLRESRRVAEAGWCQGANAMNPACEIVNPLAPEAVMFCAHGAMVRATGGDDGRLAECVKAFRKCVGGQGVHGYNDRTDVRQEDVLNVFDRAIACTL